MTRTREPLAINLNVVDVLTRAGAQILTMSQHGPAGVLWGLAHRDRRGSLIVSQATAEGVEWMHASIAFDSMPTYDDLHLLHRAVYGRKRFAYQVFAPAAEHVNYHEHALHLWGRADGEPVLPRFGQRGMV